MVEFDSYEDAMASSSAPETAELARRLAALSTRPPAFTGCDVAESSRPVADRSGDEPCGNCCPSGQETGQRRGGRRSAGPGGARAPGLRGAFSRAWAASGARTVATAPSPGG
ncbi:hypothetical protein ACU686_22340 [Yinghuangia aomiensis]